MCYYDQLQLVRESISLQALDINQQSPLLSSEEIRSLIAHNQKATKSKDIAGFFIEKTSEDQGWDKRLARFSSLMDSIAVSPIRSTDS